jgi:hypothetical protein
MQSHRFIAVNMNVTKLLHEMLTAFSLVPWNTLPTNINDNFNLSKLHWGTR